MLTQAGVAPEQAMPVLLKALSDHDAKYRVIGAYGLGRLETNAQQAVPALALLLNDPEYYVRWEVSNTLKAIDPGAAAKAGLE